MKRFTIFFFLILTLSLSAHEWKEQASGTKKDLLSISAATNKIVWISGRHGTVLRTVDEGKTWRNAGGGPVLDTMDILNIFALDSSIAFCSASPVTDSVMYKTTSYIFKTSNSGKTWTKVFTQANGRINGMFFFDTSRGVACGNPVNDRWSIWITNDGGITWDSSKIKIARASQSSSGWNNSVWGDTSSRMLAFGTNDSTLYLSTDSGKTWTPRATKGLRDILAIYFSKANGFAAGEGLLRTEDLGKTWRTVNASGTGMITGIIVHENWDCFMTRMGNKTIPDNHIYSAQNFGDSTWHVAFTAPDTSAYLYLTQARNGEGNAWAVRQHGGITIGIHSPSESQPSAVEKGNTSPDVYSLSQNYPNPFNPNTTIKYSIAERKLVSIKVFDILGKEVAVLVNDFKDAGTYTVQFDGGSLPSGMYVYRIQAGAFSETKKLILLK